MSKLASAEVGLNSVHFFQIFFHDEGFYKFTGCCT